MEMLHQALNRASGEILGAPGQSRLSFVVVTDMAGVLRRSTGVGRRIRPDSHNNSLKNLMILFIWAMWLSRQPSKSKKGS